MKIGKLILSPILILSLLISCEKKSRVEVPEEVFTVSCITADYTPVGDVDTKNEIGAVNYDVYWTAGDKIAIVNMSNGAIHSYTVNESSVGKKNGVFNADATYEYGDGDQLVAVYPYDAASLNDNKLYVSLKKDVEYLTTKNIPAFSVNDIQVSRLMTGAQFKSLITALSSISFYRMVALVSASCAFSTDVLRPQHAGQLLIYHDGISGKAQVRFDNESGEPYVNPNSGQGASNNRVSVSLPNGHLMSDVNYVVKFIPVFPLNESTGFSFVLRTEDYESGFYLKQDKDLNSGTHYLFILFDENYTQVASQSEATTHHTWWWNAIAAQNSAGSFLAPDDAKMEGNNAGSFVNAN